jgi:hypothetical protein
MLSKISECNASGGGGPDASGLRDLIMSHKWNITVHFVPD